MSRKQTCRFKCSHEGCNEFSFYEADNRAHAAKLYDTYGNGKYKCVRHSHPDEVLSNEEPVKTYSMRVFQERHGMFWGTDKASNGFVYGPGFKAYAEDFPEGTEIRITAEIIIPKPKEPEPIPGSRVTMGLLRSLKIESYDLQTDERYDMASGNQG